MAHVWTGAKWCTIVLVEEQTARDHIYIRKGDYYTRFLVSNTQNHPAKNSTTGFYYIITFSRNDWTHSPITMSSLQPFIPDPPTGDDVTETEWQTQLERMAGFAPPSTTTPGQAMVEDMSPPIVQAQQPTAPRDDEVHNARARLTSGSRSPVREEYAHLLRSGNDGVDALEELMREELIRSPSPTPPPSPLEELIRSPSPTPPSPRPPTPTRTPPQPGPRRRRRRQAIATKPAHPTYYDAPSPLDVLCGRGARTNGWYANFEYLKTVQEYQSLYVASARNEKWKTTQLIIDIVHSWGGMFLAKDDDDEGGGGEWYEIDGKSARYKVAAAFRTPPEQLAATLHSWRDN